MTDYRDPVARRRLTTAMDERRDQLGLTWRQVAAAGGLSYETVRVARKVRRDMPPRTRRGIERGLQWPSGAIDRILTGEPAPTDTPPARPHMTVVDGGTPDLWDDTERQLWAIEGLTDDEKWDYIRMHRGRQATSSAPQPRAR